MNNSGPLSFEATLQDVSFKSQLDAMERRMMGFTGTVVQGAAKIDDSFKRLGQLAAGYFSFQALSQLPAQILQVRGAYQQLEIALGTLLKSKVKADALLQDVTKFAAATPFSLQDTANGAKQLLAYGFAAKEVIPTLSKLGDVAAGLGLPLERLVFLYGTTKTSGRLFTQDLNQFVSAGIPLTKSLADQFGVAEDKIRGLVESGKVGFPEVKKAIESLTSGSGLFAGTLDAQSKSLLALKERLSSAYELMLNDIGKQNEGILASSLTTAAAVVENYQQVIDILGVLVSSFGAYRAALVITSIAQTSNIAITRAQAIAQAQAANAGGFLTLSQTRAAASTALLARAQVALNSVLAVNPYVILGTAIAALVTGYLLYKDELIEIKSTQELMAGSTKEITSSYNKQKSEVTSLISIIKNQNVAESERLNAYEKLKSINPDILAGLDFQKSKTADLTKTVNEYLVSLEKKIRLESGQGRLKEAFDQDAQLDLEIEKARKIFVQKKKIADLDKENPNGSGVKPFSLASAPVADVQEQAKAAEGVLNRLSTLKKKSLSVIEDVKSSISGIYSAKTKDALNSEISSLELTAAALTDKLSPAYKLVEDKLNGLIEQRKKLTASEKEGAKAQLITLDGINAKIKEQQDLLGQQATRSGAIAVQDEIKRLETQKRRITGEQTAEEKRLAKKAQKDADKSGPFGSIAYWETVARKAEIAASKIPDTPDNSAKLQKLNQTRFDADKKAEEIRKTLAIRSFDEEITYKRTQYELYTRWVEAYGKTSADNQFNALLVSGKSYLDFINSQITALETRKKQQVLTPDETKNLGNLLNERDVVTGKKTAIELFRENLQKAGADAQSLTDYLTVLIAKQAELNPSDNSELAIQKRIELTQQIALAETDRKNQLKQFLQSVAQSEEQRLAITKKYADLRIELEKKYTGNRGEEFKRGSDAIDEAQKREVREAKEQATQLTDTYRKLDEVVLLRGRAALKQRLADLNKYLKDEAAAKDTQAYKAKLKDRNDTLIAIKKSDLDLFSGYLNIVGQFGNALAELGGTAADAGQLLSGLASNIDLLSKAFDKETDKAEKVQIAIQSAVQLFSLITTAAAQRKKAETEYYASIIAQQQQYNLLLNEQIGLRTANKGSIFGRDYIKEAEDGYNKLNDAQSKYQEALLKLSQGKAKVGQGNAVDWANVGKAAASGATIGTAILPGIGTAIGAGIGAVVGFFAGKKKKDEFGSLLASYPALIRKSADGVDELNVELAQTLIAQNQVDDATKQLLQSTIDWQKQIDEAHAAIRAIAKDLVGDLGDKLGNSLVNAFKEGTDAALAFKGTLEDIIESFVTKLIYAKVLGPYLDQFQKDVEASLAPGGDGSIIDDAGKLFSKSAEINAKLDSWLQQLQDGAKASGFDILKNKVAADKAKLNTGSAPNSLSGAIAGVSESTANILAGQMNSIRIQQSDSAGIMRQQLLLLSGIKQDTGSIDKNTARIEKTNQLLSSVDSRLKDLGGDKLRGVGLPG